jgi:hypothetical protein
MLNGRDVPSLRPAPGAVGGLLAKLTGRAYPGGKFQLVERQPPELNWQAMLQLRTAKLGAVSAHNWKNSVCRGTTGSSQV